ncbi:MAG: hypothetical protein LH702_06110 [Phormidesmis sp. CAN_BIN44]|nr:hypothetical protein [Phormidesmis sp. CAN_BIN44]
MSKLNELKTVVVSTIAFLSFSAIATSSAFAQDKPKPATETQPVAQTRKPAPQTKPMSCCCKKMMEQKMNDSMTKMPGMNHPAPAGK